MRLGRRICAAAIFSVGLCAGINANAAVINTTSCRLGTCLTGASQIDILGITYNVDFEYFSFNELNAEGKFPLFGDEIWARSAASILINTFNSFLTPGLIISDSNGITATSFNIPYEFNIESSAPEVSTIVSNAFTTARNLNNWQTLSGVSDLGVESATIFATFFQVSVLPDPPDPDPGNDPLPPIPVPAALPLFLTALAGLGGLGYMRRRKAA